MKKITIRKMRLKRDSNCNVASYSTPCGEWRVWREPYLPRRWFIDRKDEDATQVQEGFQTKWEAVHALVGLIQEAASEEQGEAMAKKANKAKRPHRWAGAGYVCGDCGAIKDTREVGDECPGAGKTGFDLWLYFAGAGWWLDDEDLATAKEASNRLAKKIGFENVVAGAVLPAGQRLGLFTKERREK